MEEVKITFGILTGLKNINTVLNSIKNQNIKHYEIIVAGPVTLQDEHVQVYYDAELEKKCWITRKKNIIIEHSTGDIIVLMKDYVLLDSEWYNGFCKYCSSNYEWDVLMNVICDKNSKRFLDWVWNNPNSKRRNGKLNKRRLIDYKITNHPKMYVPGGFMICKSNVLKSRPFDESLVGLSRGSDVSWSEKYLTSLKYSFNVWSKCTVIGCKSEKFYEKRKQCICKYCQNFRKNITANTL